MKIFLTNYLKTISLRSFCCLLFLMPCVQASERVNVGLQNEFIVGGLFPIHASSLSEAGEIVCGNLLQDKGIQRLEAMLYAIDTINNDPDFWKISLGTTIMDTCSSDAYALEKSLQFLQIAECEAGRELNRRVTAVIGAANSPVSESVASILRLFKIPQVSYASTSEELDNRHKYPYFFRVVPSDKFQIEAIIDLLKQFKWSYISTVTAKGEYGEKALQKLRYKISNSSQDICFAAEEILPREPVTKDYKDVINRLLDHKKAQAVVVFLNEDKLRELLAATKGGKAEGRFLWLGSDSWGAKSNPIIHQEQLAEGAITILPTRYPVPGFDEYFLSLKPNTNTRNPWFAEFWEKHFNCELPGGHRKRNAFLKAMDFKRKKKCSQNEDLRPQYKQEGLVPKVIDSVYVIAHALKAMCADEFRCQDMKRKMNGKILKDFIREVEFNSSQGRGIVVQVNNQKNTPVNYTIYRFRKTEDNKYEYKPIGTWNNHNKLLMHDKTFYPGQSSCSLPCKKGEERIRSYQRRCCWNCTPCDVNEFLPNEYSRCTQCPVGTSPVSDKTSCHPLKPVYMGSDWGNPWTSIPCAFACLGILGTLIVFVIFQSYNQTPVIKAAGRELCYVILVGVIFCYIFTFVCASKPTKTSCGILRIGLGLGLSICYAAIFTKTNRISRIFNRKLSNIRPSYISPTSQLIICFTLVLIQLTLTIMWLIIRPPTVIEVPVENPPAYVITCGIDSTSVQLGLMFNMMLITLCTIYAFKTRNIPENFNEAKYISFAMYSSCIVWLAFVAIYSSTWKDLEVQSTILCMSVSMSGTVVLLCIFFPKLYIVLLKPHKNVHNPTINNSANAVESLGVVRFLKADAGTSHLSPTSTSSTHQSYNSQDANLQ